MKSNTILLLILVLSVSCDRKQVSEINTENMDTTQIVHTEYEGLIEGPSGRLYVESKGSGRIPIVFLHSFGGSTAQWENQIRHLREHRQVVAFDFRGHGKSELPDNRDYSAEALASDVESVIDSLRIDRFILVGHSMGGVAAITYAGNHPERVAGLVMVGTPGKTLSDQSNPVIQSLESPSYQQVMDDYMKRLLINAKSAVDSSVTEEFNSISKEASISIIKAMFAFDPVPSLAKYTGQKLIISTTAEAKQPNTLHKLAPEVDHKTVDGTSHWIHLDKPEEFNEILDEFLKRVK